MKKTYNANDFIYPNFQKLNQRIAYHEAGHATAIYLYNQRKQLPPIFFQIVIADNFDNALKKQRLDDYKNSDNYKIVAKIEGGYLVEDLELGFLACQSDMDLEEQTAYYTALQADVVNLLAGSVTEAYFLSWRDSEVLNSQMLTLESLVQYGNESDFKKIAEYSRYLSSCPLEQQQKLSECLHETFAFISHPQIWKSIKSVAEFILTSEKSLIHCEEIFQVIDANFSTNQVIAA